MYFSVYKYADKAYNVNLCEFKNTNLKCFVNRRVCHFRKFVFIINFPFSINNLNSGIGCGLKDTRNNSILKMLSYTLINVNPVGAEECGQGVGI